MCLVPLRSLTLALLLAVPAHAQDDEAARRAAAEAYVQSPTQQEMIRQILSPEVFSAQIRAQFPAFTDEQVAKMAAIATEEMTPLIPEIERATIEAAVANFTTEEIVALDEFYRTEEGASVARKMQPFMQSVFEIAAPTMQAAQQRMMGRVGEVMQ